MRARLTYPGAAGCALPVTPHLQCVQQGESKRERRRSASRGLQRRDDSNCSGMARVCRCACSRTTGAR